MRRLAAPVAAVLAFVGALAPLLLLEGSARSWTFRAYALVVGVTAASAVVHRIDAAEERTAEELRLEPFHRPRRVVAVAQTWWNVVRHRRTTPYEGGAVLVKSATLTAGAAHHRLRPVLCAIAEERLRGHHGITLDHPRAAEMFSPESWDMLRPDRPVPDDRLAPGITVSALARLLDDLEAC
jgi:hypothetical protein